MVDEHNVIVAVGSTSLTTTDGSYHTLLVGDMEIALSSMELDNLHTAIHAYLTALRGEE